MPIRYLRTELKFKILGHTLMQAEEGKAKAAEDSVVWFAMSATYGRELKAKALLDEKDEMLHISSVSLDNRRSHSFSSL